MTLTEKQQADLDGAVLDYLQQRGFTATADAFQAESGTPKEVEAKLNGLLEKKWTAVLRLQKKVLELESKLSDAEETIQAPQKLGATKDRTTWIPRPPAKHALTGHRLPVTCVKFHPVFSVFVSGSEDASIKIWDYESGEYERTLKGHTNTVQDLAFDDKGEQMASCSADMTVRLWSFEGFECTKTLRGHDHNISSVCFVPGGGMVVSASRDKTIRVWETATGYCSKIIRGHDDWVRAVRVSPDGQSIATCSNDQSCRLFDLNSGDERHEMRGHSHVVECIAWAPEAAKQPISTAFTGVEKDDSLIGPFMASAGRDKTIVVWDVSSGSNLFTLRGHDNWIKGLVFHPGGKLLLSCADDKTIRIWDLETKRCMKTLQAHDHFVNTIDMHPTGPYVVSAGVDLTTKIWECR
eukprot:m.337315 g.337315  ORF g.337315 m.337315 type:complete len:409 (+) comp18099_c0_seq1:207-1433(+)